jgi:hypothetical protein
MRLTDLMPMVERAYRVLPGRENRAMAGLSMGGMQTFLTTLANLDQFAYLGGFSGSTGSRRSSFDPKASNNGVFADAAAFNKKVKVLFLGIGSMEGPGTRNFRPVDQGRYQERLFRVSRHGPRVADLAPVPERFRSPALQIGARRPPSPKSANADPGEILSPERLKQQQKLTEADVMESLLRLGHSDETLAVFDNVIHIVKETPDLRTGCVSG